MSIAIVVLGSNMGDRKSHLQQALERISSAGKITAISDVYETFGAYEKRNPYLNVCIEINTDLKSHQLMLFLGETQGQVVGDGEESEAHSILDCDLISYDKEVMRTPQLTLPHPEAHRRAFVMIPLAQIRPDWVHPLLKKTAEDLAKEAYWAGWGTFFTDGKSLLDF